MCKQILKDYKNTSFHVHHGILRFYAGAVQGLVHDE